MWPIVIGAIGAAASVFNAADEATSNRAIREKLDKAIAYLELLNTKLDTVIQQNKDILHALDELPAKIRSIVQEIVDVAFIEREYASLHAVYLNITRLRRDYDYRITKPGWTVLSQSLTYVFLHENRLSNMLDLIRYCELALVATRNQARPFITTLLSDKVALIKLLRDELAARAQAELVAASNLLNRTEYIVSHNLTDSLPSLDGFTYSSQPDRLMTVNYTERVCRSGTDKCGDWWERCWDEPRTRQEPDTPFHNARDAHRTAINAKIEVIRAQLREITYVTAVIDRLEAYRKRVESLSVASARTEMFYPATHPKGVTVRQTAREFDASDELLFREYFDDIDAVLVKTDAAQDVPHQDGWFQAIMRICPPV